MTGLREATTAAVDAAKIILTFAFVLAGTLGALVLPVHALGALGLSSVAWFAVALGAGCTLAGAWLMFWVTLLLPESENDRGRISETHDEDPRE